MDFEERVDAFRVSCSLYLAEKKILAGLRKKKKPDFMDKKRMKLLADDIARVEHRLQVIEEKSGIMARACIWLLYVDLRTELEVCDEFKLSRRQLQYALYRWLRESFEEE